MSESNGRHRPKIEKRGGYSGSQSAETVRPPSNVPSGYTPPSSSDAGKTDTTSGKSTRD